MRFGSFAASLLFFLPTLSHAAEVEHVAADDAAADPASYPLTERVPDALVVNLKDGTSRSQLAILDQKWGVDFEPNSVAFDSDGVAISRGAITGDLDALEDLIAQDPAVESVEPLVTYQMLYVPNDERYGEQWNFKLIHMEQAWDRSKGDGVVVAVIDTGVAYETRGNFKVHPDLADARFVPGYDFVGDTDHPNDDQGHGTHVAGTIAQVTGNKIGVAGIAPKAKLMPIKVLSASGSGTVADIADGIRWAADHGAQVINMSLGGPFPSPVMREACDYARKKGVTVIAAAGNSGSFCRNDCRIGYPAGYESVIAVSAVGPDGSLAPYSSWGKGTDIAAPGGDKTKGNSSGVLQGTMDGAYDWFQGTSMASPHVAGVAALLVSAGAKTPDAVEKALYAGAARKGDADWTPKYGHGLLDADASLKAVGAGGGASDWSTVAVRAGLGLGLIALMQSSLRKRYLKIPPVSPTFAIAALMGCVGLFFLRSFGLPSIPFAGRIFGLLASPVPDWEQAILGTRPTPIFYSAIIPFSLALLCLPFPRLRKFIAGLCIGYTAFLLQVAWAGTPPIAWIPWRILSVNWLVINALVGWMMARELTRLNADPLFARSV